jgi:hypothetical protein
MPLLIEFPVHEDRLRAIDILAEAEETYHGLARCYVVSDTAAKLLENNGVHFQIVGGEAGSRESTEQLAAKKCR